MLTDSRERSRILSEAFDREIEARGLTKKAKILKSGTFQGAAGGAGIGAATGIGLGTVVGTVVGTVASVPTTALGGLVGAGTGAIHGPWIKLGTEKGKDGKEEEKLVQVPQDAIDKGDVEVDDATGQVTAKDPEALKKSVENEEREGESKPKKEDDPKEKKRAPKLEVRSKKPSTESKKEPEKSNNVETAKRKPPKLGPKSGNQGATKTSKTPRGTNPAPKQKAPKLDVHAK